MSDYNVELVLRLATIVNEGRKNSKKKPFCVDASAANAILPLLESPSEVSKEAVLKRYDPLGVFAHVRPLQPLGQLGDDGFRRGRVLRSGNLDRQRLPRPGTPCLDF